MQNQLINKIVICGLGAIGSNLLVMLARLYPQMEFVGIDFDRIEDRNIGTQAYFLEQVRQPKARAIAVVLARYVRGVKYRGVDQRLVNPNEGLENELVIDAFDNPESRALISGPHCLHIGFSPLLSAECLWHEQYDVPGEVDPRHADICGMQGALPFIMHVVSLSATVIDRYLREGVRSGFLITNRSTVKWIT